MSVQGTKLTAIADAIREMDGTTELIPADDYPDRIRAIPKGLYPQIVVTVDAGAVAICSGEGQSFQGTSVDGTVVFDVPGYGTWSLSAVKDGAASGTVEVVVDTVKQYAVTLAFVRIYGVEWDGSSTTKLTRTDDAALFADPSPAVNNGTGSSPFDDIMPWAGMKRVTDAQAGELVEIPKFWYKLTKIGDALKIQIAAEEVDGFSVSPAHMDRGDGHGERDVVYIGRYHCASTYKSTTTVKPIVNISRATARTKIHALGSAIWHSDFAMRFTIWLLYLVEFADWDSQSTIGGGCSQTTASATAVFSMGSTDTMQYHTGTVSSTHSAYGECQYRWIEGLWSNCNDWADGCYAGRGVLNIILNPEDFNDVNGGVISVEPTNGYPSAMGISVQAGAQWMYPTSSNGDATTYVPDTWSSPTGTNLFGIVFGGVYLQSKNNGLFYVAAQTATSQLATIGSRLMKLPNAT